MSRGVILDESDFEARAAEIVMICRCWLSLVGYTSTIPEEYPRGKQGP
jgi:hypothetical protein